MEKKVRLVVINGEGRRTGREDLLPVNRQENHKEEDMQSTQKRRTRERMKRKTAWGMRWRCSER